MKVALYIAATLVLLGAVTWWRYLVWVECAKDHPWWYCLRIVA